VERIRQRRPWLLDSKFEIAIFEGWERLVGDLLDEIGCEMAKYPQARLKILQIKEKFGGLRFYFELKKAPDELRDAVRACYERAEKLSWSICEVCGQPGHLRHAADREWFWVRCDQHASEGSKIVGTSE